jgi:hypothetical protein
MKRAGLPAPITVLAALCLLAGTTVSLAHTVAEQAPNHHPVVKEQKDWGIAGSATLAERTVRIAMTDNMRFTPDHLQVRQGATVRIILVN